MHVSIHSYMNVFVHVHTYIHIQYIYIQVHIFIHTHKYIHTFIYIRLIHNHTMIGSSDWPFALSWQEAKENYKFRLGISIWRCEGFGLYFCSTYIHNLQPYTYIHTFTFVFPFPYRLKSPYQAAGEVMGEVITDKSTVFEVKDFEAAVRGHCNDIVKEFGN